MPLSFVVKEEAVIADFGTNAGSNDALRAADIGVELKSQDAVARIKGMAAVAPQTRRRQSRSRLRAVA